MSSDAPKTAGSDWVIDLFPGAAAFPVCSKLATLVHLGPLQTALAVFVIGLLGCGVGVAASYFLRQFVGRTVRNARMAKSIGIAVSLVLALALVVTAAAVESATGDTKRATPSNVPPETWSKVNQAISSGDATIIVQTSAQDAAGLAEADITNEEVGRWAAALSQQAGVNARQACADRGGDVRTCSQLNGKETHQVLQIRGRKIAIIRFDLYTGTDPIGHTVRIMGLKDGKLVTVACVRATGEPIEPSMSPCAEEIAKSLGARL
jgi:hypothetical protein